MDEYAVAHAKAVEAVRRICTVHCDLEHAEKILDELTEHIGATAEAGVMARLRSKLALLPDSPAKYALEVLLEVREP